MATSSNQVISIEAKLVDGENHLRSGEYLLAFRDSLVVLSRLTGGDKDYLTRVRNLACNASDKLAEQAQKDDNVTMTQIYTLWRNIIQSYKPAN